jgi:hypothetical protein
VPQTQLDAQAEGVVGHLLFEGLAASLQAQPTMSFSPQAKVVEKMLVAAGASAVAAARIATRLADWFRHASERDNVKFVFAHDHVDAVNEMTLVATDGAKLRLDRTFIAADSTRWLIDFKFSEPANALAVAREAEQYRAQLQSYAERLAALDRALGKPRPIRAALYFPWLDLLHPIEL